MRVWLIHMGEFVQSDGPGVRLWRLGLLADQLEQEGHEVVRWIPTFVHTHKSQRFEADTVVDISAQHQIRHIYAKGYARHLGPGRFRFHREIARRWETLQEGVDAPDIIVTSMPTPEICAAARRIAASRHIPFIIDVRDLWPDVLYETVPTWAAGLARIVAAPVLRNNRRSFKSAAAVIGISDKYVQWGVSFAGRERTDLDRVFVHGYAPPSPPADEIAAAKARWQEILSPKARMCLFLGTMSGRFHDDLATVVQAARRLDIEQPGHFEWVFGGDGPSKSSLEKECEEMPNVHFPGWVGGADIVALLDLASIGLAPYGEGVKMSLPNKPFEYASAGIPIVSSLRGEFDELLTRNTFGTSYPPGDDARLADILGKYYADPDLIANHGNCGRRLWEREFSASTVYGEMVKFLEVVAKVGKSA
jgi:glycosyltransferase involved in cell wall biosynthesis